MFSGARAKSDGLAFGYRNPSASAMRKNVAFYFVIIHFHFGFAKKM